MDPFIPFTATDSIALVKHVLSTQEKYPDQRTGQVLFNYCLPSWAREATRATPFDPFYHEWDFTKLHAWCEEHLIFDTYGICAVHYGNQIRAERPPQEN